MPSCKRFTMKKIALLLPLVCSFTIQAHVMGPISWGGPDNLMESTTVDGIVIVPIKLEAYDGSDFDIEVDGTVIKTFTLAKNESRKFRVPVQLREKSGKVEKHKICSVSSGKIRTRICTKVKAVWLK